MDYGTVHKNPLTPEAVQLLSRKANLLALKPVILAV